ncbi:DUF1905 domain-containing protein [Candidatus Kaiserbacteria bacterium]|nr:DUF1905 domain-containing protein [Candidatus Kaiserbacteria bacterium]
MTKKSRVSFKSRVVVWPGDKAAWRFLYMPKSDSAMLRKEFGRLSRGFSSLPVTATIHKISWDTSLFYDTRSACYLLPLKAQIRRKAEIDDDDTLTCVIALRI